MALTFTSWTNSDDAWNPVIDWTDVDAVRHWPNYIHAEALRQALVERMTACGYSLGSGNILYQPITDLQHQPLTYWASFFDGVVNDLAGRDSTPYQHRFIQHTDNGGSWNGQADCAPYWTESTFDAQLSYPWVDMTWTTTAEVFAEWAWQRYEALNLLRWTRKDTSHYLNIGESGPSYWRDTIQKAIDDSWANSTSDILNMLGGYSYVKRDDDQLPDNFAGQAMRERANYRTDGIPYTIAHACDFYAYGKVPSNLTPLTSAVWDAEATGYLQDVWNLLESTSPAVEQYTVTASKYGGTGAPPMYPATPNEDEYTFKGWYLGDGRAVVKWNVAGGFTFQT